MKRLFGLIGLVYLSSLTAVFYFNISIVIILIAAPSAVAAAVAIKIIKKNFAAFKTVVALALTSMFAVLSIILYQNIIVNPIVNEYSDKEITLTGYIADEPEYSAKAKNYVIETFTVNGENKSIKVLLRSYYDLKLEAFDKVSARINVYETAFDNTKSEGIFLRVDTSGNFTIEKTGEKHQNLYSCAVSIRQWIKKELRKLFAGDEHGVIQAVLIGDKSYISEKTYHSFSDTGMSYLIVVSGMHLSILLSGVILLSKRYGMKLPLLIASIVFILIYAAVTGFAPSVVRAGIMLIIVLTGTCKGYQHDSVNSLGIAALFLTIGNPYAVGNTGLLLSFSATLGIILWATPLYEAIAGATRHKKRKIKIYMQIVKDKPTTNLRIKMLALKTVDFIIGLFSVSVSAAVWVMPVTIIAYGKIAVLTVFISLLAEPLTVAMLWSSLFAVLFSFLPPVFNLFALAANMICRLLINVIGLFSSIPFSSVKADNVYAYVWLGFTVAIIVTCAVLRRYKFKGFFLPAVSVIMSLLIMVMCTAAAFIIRSIDSDIYLSVISTDGGITVSVTGSRYASLLSCGGRIKDYDKIAGTALKEYKYIDRIIIPRQTQNYSALYGEFCSQFDVSNTLVYDYNKSGKENDYENARMYSPQTTFSAKLSPRVDDRIIAASDFSCQYITTENTTVLFLTTGSDIEKLPEKYQTAKYIIMPSVPKNWELLSCERLFFTGSNESFENHSDELGTIAGQVTEIINNSVKVKI